ncbi:Uncharacterised protein [Klebsiella variicola]|uniref:Uncharacterized protein n=1 Tax=Klebsiella variicola TaxID=244366 RepID=A0A7H4MM97_KLEVA|nr:Uncharacterised protein [Klebsiella variicola]
MAEYYALRIYSFVPKRTLRLAANNEKEGGMFSEQVPIHLLTLTVGLIGIKECYE